MSVNFDKDISADRALDTDTWSYLYTFIEDCRSEKLMPNTLNEKKRIRWLRYWHRAEAIFAILYLLGIRISEISKLQMSSLKQLDNVDEGKIIRKYWWASVMGKGNKTRVIPVPNDLIEVIMNYRRFLNTFPDPAMRKIENDEYSLGSFNELPSPEDDSFVILSITGRVKISSNRIYVIIKEVLEKAVEHIDTYLEECAANNAKPKQIDATKLKKASSHWLRHTSATHQGLFGVSLRFRQQTLGHESIETTLIYDHTNKQKWALAVSNFPLKNISKHE